LATELRTLLLCSDESLSSIQQATRTTNKQKTKTQIQTNKRTMETKHQHGIEHDNHQTNTTILSMPSIQQHNNVNTKIPARTWKVLNKENIKYQIQKHQLFEYMYPSRIYRCIHIDINVSLCAVVF
jgi:hypothetical protein